MAIIHTGHGIAMWNLMAKPVKSIALWKYDSGIAKLTVTVE
jgi:hypothetical protein